MCDEINCIQKSVGQKIKNIELFYVLFFYPVSKYGSIFYVSVTIRLLNNLPDKNYYLKIILSIGNLWDFVVYFFKKMLIGFKTTP